MILDLELELPVVLSHLALDQFHDRARAHPPGTTDEGLIHEVLSQAEVQREDTERGAMIEVEAEAEALMEAELKKMSEAQRPVVVPTESYVWFTNFRADCGREAHEEC